MRFLVDEGCDFAIVRALRAEGHDVKAVVEEHRGASDEEVVAMAVVDQRVLVTEDKDFGQIAYARSRFAIGIILVRFRASARSSIGQTIAGLVRKRGEPLHGSFVVVSPGRIRIAGKQS